MLKAIIFDYGKVLTLPPSSDDWARLAACFDVSVQQFQEPYWGLREDYDRARYTAETYWRAVGAHLGKKVTDAGVEHLTALDNAQWTNINPEMLEFAWQAQDSGLKIGILSNMQFDMLAEMRRKFDWLDRFDTQLYTCELGAIKPEPEAYNAALRALSARAEDSIFFDDKQVNVDGARAVGMHAELFAGDVQSAYLAVNRLGVALAARKAAD